MPIASKSGIKGLQKRNGKCRIDLRYKDPQSGEQRRYIKDLPQGTSAEKAKDVARETLNAAMKGVLFVPSDVKEWRLHECLDAYVDWCRINRPKTLRDRISISKIVKNNIADKKMNALTQADVEDYKQKRAAAVSKSTINRGVAMIKHLMTRAKAEGWIKKDVADAVCEVELLEEPPHRVRWVTKEEEKKLMAALPRELRRLVVAARLTGLRRGELLALTKDCIDFDRKQIHVKHSKSNKARFVPSHPQLIPLLAATMKDSLTSHVFGDRNGEPLSKHVSHRFKAAVDKAGIHDMRFPDLRHDAASSLKAKLVSNEEIAKILGHASLAMTMRYAHIESEQLHSAIARMPSVAGLELDSVDHEDLN